ncbi:MAG: hypothetical protein JW941_02640 [Candidatus Coatesbacteria bacterium]|nr:hypothetical protein [Candidatus Coatesbacteria bacterium]
MAGEKKNCPECGNKLNYSRSDDIYLCPYCGEEFRERDGKLRKKSAVKDGPRPQTGKTAEEMREELESAFGDTLLGAQLEDDKLKRARRRDEAQLFELRLKATEAKRMLKVANRTGISLCIFFDFVVLALAYNYDLFPWGLGLSALITIGTYFYLSSYASKVKKWEERVMSETREIEKGIYLEELSKKLDDEDDENREIRMRE